MQNPIVRVLEVVVVAGACAAVAEFVKDQSLAAKLIAGIAVLASQYGVSLPKFGAA
jgi:hypothetical protein